MPHVEAGRFGEFYTWKKLDLCKACGPDGSNNEVGWNHGKMRMLMMGRRGPDKKKFRIPKFLGVGEAIELNNEGYYPEIWQSFYKGSLSRWRRSASKQIRSRLYGARIHLLR